MGSPGVFIHSGTLGGRLLTLSLAPTASVPARPLVMAVPATNAALSCRNRRRDVAAVGLSRSVGSAVAHPQFRNAGPTTESASAVLSATSDARNATIARQPLHPD